MEVRITKLRVAMAAPFVLAGVGLASVLSPLVSTALATVGQTVNISDHSASAYFAKVTSAGELKTNGVVSGKVALRCRRSRSVCSRGPLEANIQPVLGPTTATVALTDVTLATFYGNIGGRSLFLFPIQRGGTEHELH